MGKGKGKPAGAHGWWPPGGVVARAVGRAPRPRGATLGGPVWVGRTGY